MTIRLAKPSLTNTEIQSVAKILRSGYFVQSEVVRRFEENLAAFLGVKHAVAVSSGTAALHLATLACGIGPNDEVIVPDFTFPATANVVELAGAKPIFVDVDLDTFNIDSKSIERCITKRTKAIMPVHQFGLAADMGLILRIARKHGLKIIEDAACALGAKYHGKLCGTFGDAACFSFHPRKIITTGEGGTVVTNNSTIAEKIRLLRNHGLAKINGSRFDLVIPGFNYRMTEFQAAIGIEQLKRLPSLLANRRKIVTMYQRELLGLPLVLPRAGESERVFQSYVVLLPNSIDRDKFIKNLREDGVETTIGSYALHRISYYKKRYSSSGRLFPNSDRAFFSTLSLPIAHDLKIKDIRKVTRSISKCLSRNSR